MEKTIKQVPFKNEHLEMCRNCHGSGFVVGGYNCQAMPVCDVCGGSGVIKKVIEGTVTIEQYDNRNRL